MRRDFCGQERVGPSEILCVTYLRTVPLKLGYLSTNFHDSIAAGHTWGINFPAFST